MTYRRITELVALILLVTVCACRQTVYRPVQQQTKVSVPAAGSVPALDSFCTDSDALQYATLVKIQDYVGESLSANDAEFDRVTQRTVDEQRSKVACFRDWARTLKDGCVKESYLEWARYYDNRINECEHELVTHEQRDATVQRERADETGKTPLARGHLLAERLPSPPEPCPIVRKQ